MGRDNRWAVALVVVLAAWILMRGVVVAGVGVGQGMVVLVVRAGGNTGDLDVARVVGRLGVEVSKQIPTRIRATARGVVVAGVGVGQGMVVLVVRVGGNTGDLDVARVVGRLGVEVSKQIPTRIRATARGVVVRKVELVVVVALAGAREVR